MKIIISIVSIILFGASSFSYALPPKKQQIADQYAQRRATAVTNPVPLNLDSDGLLPVPNYPPQTGIINVCDSDQTITATNCWAGILNNIYKYLYAGALRVDGQQGIIAIQTNSASAYNIINTPLYDGPSLIISEQNGVITLITASNVLQFDATSEKFISVKSRVTSDLNGDGVVNIYDLNIINAALNNPAIGFDSRDLNHDGNIDALDARILVTQCTKPRCAL